MKVNNLYVIYNINRNYPPKRISVTHVNDVNTRSIELELRQGDELLEIDPGFTAEASIVERRTKRLINNSVPCTIDESGNIIIPIDDLQIRGKMDINIEVSVSDSSNNQVLTLPYPLWVRVNPSILDDAEVSTESLGTVPELLEEAKEIIEGERYVLTEEDKEQIASMVNISGKEDSANKVNSISAQSQTSDSVNYPNVNAVRDYTDSKVGELEDYVDDELDDMDTAKADKATTLAGYGIADAYTKAEADALIELAPSYVQNEADRVTGVAANHQGSRTFNIGMISDMHIYSDLYPEDTATDTYYNYYAARHACQGLERISKNIHLNAFAMLGDYIVGDQSMGYTDGVVKINRLASNINSDRDIRLVGNHDYGFRISQGYAPSFVYPFVTAYNAGMVMGDKVKGYGYYDNEEFKIRVIALNTTEYDGTGAPASEYNISTAQKIWFANALDMSSKSDAAAWQILILSHHPLDWNDANTAAETDAVSILKAYKSGSTVTISATTIDFANKNSAVIIGNIHGHLHNYLSGTIYGTNYKRWCCPSACFDSTNRYYNVWRESTTYGKTIRSAEDTAFAIFSIDLDNHTLSRIHYGAGYDTIDDVYYTSGGYTNVVPTSIDTDGTIYNGIGYANGYRISSSGSPTAYSGSVATGYIAAVKGDVIRIKGVDWNVTDTGSEHSEKCYLVECNSSFSVVGSHRNDQYTLTKDGDIYIYTAGYTAAAYIRLNGIGNGENLIVTVNEEID